MKQKVRRTLLLLMAAVLLWGLALPASAEDAVSDPPQAQAANASVISIFPTPARAYTATTGRTTTYVSPNGAVSGYIDGTDEIIINAIYTDQWAQISYPLAAGGYKTAYCPASAILTHMVWGSEFTSFVALEQLNVYKRADLNEYYGYAPAGDTVMLVGINGNSWQIIYELVDGSHKVGWITANPSRIYVDSSTFIQPETRAYTITTGRTTTYTLPNGATASGYIDGEDEIVIKEVYENDWVKVSYPLIGGGNKEAFCPLSAIVPSDSFVGFGQVTSNTNVYKRSNLSEYYGYVTSADGFTILARSGNSLQICYSLDAGGYKIGWVPASAVTIF